MDCIRLKDAGREAIGNAKSSTSLDERLSVISKIKKFKKVIYLSHNLFRLWNILFITVNIVCVRASYAWDKGIPQKGITQPRLVARGCEHKNVCVWVCEETRKTSHHEVRMKCRSAVNTLLCRILRCIWCVNKVRLTNESKPAGIRSPTFLSPRVANCIGI